MLHWVTPLRSILPPPRRASTLWKNMSFLGGRRVEKGRVTRHFRVVYFAHFRFLNTPASGNWSLRAPVARCRLASCGVKSSATSRDFPLTAAAGGCGFNSLPGSLRYRQSCYRFSPASVTRVIDSRGMCPAHIALRNGSNLKKGGCC